jgi:hypothetical protein
MRIYLTALVFCWSVVHAQNGQLDSTFGNGGRVWVDFGSDNDMAVAYCRGTNLLAAVAPPNRIAVAKLLPSGALDSTFGNAGIATADLIVAGSTTPIQIDPVFVAGTCTDSAEPVIAVSYTAPGFAGQNVQMYKASATGIFSSVDLLTPSAFPSGTAAEAQVQSITNVGGDTFVMTGRTRLIAGEGRAFVARKAGSAALQVGVMGATGYTGLFGVWSDGAKLFGIGPYVQAGIQNVGYAEVTLDANLGFVSNLPGSAPLPGTFINETIGMGKRRFFGGGTQYLMPVQSASGAPSLISSTGTGSTGRIQAPAIATINGVQPILANGRSGIALYGNNTGSTARLLMAGLAQFDSVPAQQLGHYIAEYRLTPGSDTEWQVNPDFGNGGAVTIPYQSTLPVGCAPATNFRNLDLSPPFANPVIVGRGNRGTCTNFDAYMIRLVNGDRLLRDGFE